MKIADLREIEGRTYPARRKTQNLAGGQSPIQAEAFSMGYVTLEPKGGQVPWHNHDQEEVYFIDFGTDTNVSPSQSFVVSAYISHSSGWEIGIQLERFIFKVCN